MPRYWSRRAQPLLQSGDADLSAVFDPASGETHFLSDLPAMLLSVVDDEPCQLHELIDRLGGEMALDEVAQARVSAALVSLQRAELIESELRDSA